MDTKLSQHKIDRQSCKIPAKPVKTVRFEICKLKQKKIRNTGKFYNPPPKKKKKKITKEK